MAAWTLSTISTLAAAWLGLVQSPTRWIARVSDVACGYVAKIATSLPASRDWASRWRRWMSIIVCWTTTRSQRNGESKPPAE